MNAETANVAERQRAMGLLARASSAELSETLDRLWPQHRAQDLKPAETGLVMLRGRAGGDGAPFNVGEATVTRAVVELPSGERGYAHILGRDATKARMAATLDALWQRESDRVDVERQVLDPIARRLTAERDRARAETAATRVNFFTLVRGEDG